MRRGRKRAQHSADAERPIEKSQVAKREKKSPEHFCVWTEEGFSFGENQVGGR